VKRKRHRAGGSGAPTAGSSYLSSLSDSSTY